MRILCLWSPRVSATLALRQRPALAGRPFVVIAGRGDDALVADASPAALAEGVLAGMRAGQARFACPRAVSVPDNAGACLDELERAGGIVGRRFGLRWAAGGREHLLFELPRESTADEARLARQAAAVAVAWSGLEFRAGVASTVARAREVARAARRWPVIEPANDTPAKGINPLPGQLAVELRTAARSSVAAAVLVAGKQLTRLLAAYDASFREATLEVSDGSETQSWRLKPPVPLHDAAMAAEQLVAALPGGTAGVRLRLALGRLGPDVRVQPCAAALGETHGRGAPERRTLRRAS